MKNSLGDSYLKELYKLDKCIQELQSRYQNPLNSILINNYKKQYEYLKEIYLKEVGHYDDIRAKQEAYETLIDSSEVLQLLIEIKKKREIFLYAESTNDMRKFRIAREKLSDTVEVADAGYKRYVIRRKI